MYTTHRTKRITTPNISDPVDETIQGESIHLTHHLAARCTKINRRTRFTYVTDGNVRFASACSIQFYLTRILTHSHFNSLSTE